MSATITAPFVPSAPDRSLEQRLVALANANEIRIYRARLKVKVREGLLSPVEVLHSKDVRLANMKAFDLLMAVPGWGHVKCRRVLSTLEISPSKTINGLSDRQRKVLTAELRGAAARRRRRAAGVGS